MSSSVNKRGLLPKLRFPEFREAGEWKLIPLNKQAKRCAQKNRGGGVKRVLTNSAEYGVVDQRDYFDKDIATQGNLEGYFIVEKGDYVYNPRISTTAPVGPISKNNVATGVMSPLYTVFRFNNSNNDFYALYFKTTGWHHYMRQASSTGARHDRMAITNDDFMAMPLPVTCPEEQQKIADCLASLDELITLEAQKLDTLKAHKKGLMQQLFPAEGETLPKLRFSEFLDAGEWHCAQLGEMISTVTPPKRIPTTSYLPEGLFPIIDQGQSEIAGWTNDSAALVEANSPLIVFGDHTCALKLIKRSFAQGADGIKIISGGKLVDSDFLYQFLCSRPVAQEEYKRHFSILKEKIVAYPDRKSGEQQKIADCLSSLDDLITAQAQKLTALKTHKKGLMQQLFPVLDEVSA